MNFFEQEIERLKEYFQNTPFIIFLLSCLPPISSLISIIWSLISKNPFFIFIAVLCILVYFIIEYIDKKNNYINLKSLYLDNDTYLINTITSIIETKKLKQNSNINHVNVDELKCIYKVSKANIDFPQQSKLDVEWVISGNTLDKELYNYNIIYTKDKVIKCSNPKVKIKEIKEEYDAVVSIQNNNLLNHFEVAFKNGSLPRNSQFVMSIELNDYYKFLWNDCEILIINTFLWGDKIQKVNINLTFEDSKIANSIISVYKVSSINFQRKLVNQAPCQKNDSNQYEYHFNYDKKISNAFFIIKIPKIG